MNNIEINCQLLEQMKSVLNNAYGNINREAWDRWLTRGAISKQLEILETMQLDQPPGIESLRILRRLLVTLSKCEPENIPEAGCSTSVGIYTMRRGIESLIAVLPAPLANLWSIELQAANNNDQELLDKVQKGNDQLVCELNLEAPFMPLGVRRTKNMTMRDEFEKRYESECCLDKNNETGEYTEALTNDLWEAYQAGYQAVMESQIPNYYLQARKAF